MFKDGDSDDPSNGRGITVVVILAKLSAMVLEARASAWAEHWKCRARGQAGLRKEFRTTDQVFIIQTLMHQARHKPYTCFVGFKKAFDVVPCCMLWNIPKERGMEGKMLTSFSSNFQKHVCSR